MANIMQSMRVQNKPDRNPFDMSENIAFTACLGAYLPISHMHLNAGDKIDEDFRFFSRTQPVRSAAYGRIRETFDFFFVPYRLLCDNYEAFFTDGKHLISETSQSSAVNINTVPYFTASKAGEILVNTYGYSLPFVHAQEKPEDTVTGLNSTSPGLSFYGPCRAQDMRRLLSYLGYGKLVDFGHSDSYQNQAVNLASFDMRSNKPLNAFPLLAYHKIYYDFYRNTQWENNQPHMWYFRQPATSYTMMDISTPSGNYVDSPHLFDLHYCNYEKDKFLGVLPNSQLGQPSVVNTINQFISSPTSGYSLGIEGSSGVGYTTSGVSNTGTSTISPLSDLAKSNFNFSILALRQASAMQKYLEISQFNPMDYKHQIKAHYGFDIDQGRSNLVQWIDGASSLVEINPLLNQNLSGDNQGVIQGKGDNVGKCHIGFTAPEPGIFMAIYHANPLVDYNGDWTPVAECLKHFNTDFPIPEFDSIGLESVYKEDIDLRATGQNSSLPDVVRNTLFSPLGYAPRYIDFKSRVDRTLGDFNLSRSSWVLPLDTRVTLGYQQYPDYVGTVASDRVNILQQYCRFKVSPKAADNIFFYSPGSTFNNYQSDHLNVDAMFSCTKISNLNRNGLPY